MRQRKPPRSRGDLQINSKQIHRVYQSFRNIRRLKIGGNAEADMASKREQELRTWIHLLCKKRQLRTMHQKVKRKDEILRIEVTMYDSYLQAIKEQKLLKKAKARQT